MKKERLFSKKDLILFIGILLSAGLLAFVSGVRQQKGGYLRIAVDGEIYGEYSLEADREVLVQESYGRNRITIRQGKVSVTEADCPDQYCVRHSAIERSNEVIVCLPHRLVLEIITDRPEETWSEDGQIDGIVQ